VDVEHLLCFACQAQNANLYSAQACLALSYQEQQEYIFNEVGNNTATRCSCCWTEGGGSGGGIGPCRTVSHTIFAFKLCWYVTPVLVKQIGNDIFTFECCFNLILPDAKQEQSMEVL
jgi:hypothetical protein